jgi:hypothetical protein
MDALEKRLKKRRKIFDKFFKSVNHHFFVTDKNYLKLMKLNRELDGLVQRGGDLTQENINAGLTEEQKHKINKFIKNKTPSLFYEFIRSIPNDTLKEYVQKTYKKKVSSGKIENILKTFPKNFKKIVATAPGGRARPPPPPPPGGVTSTGVPPPGPPPPPGGVTSTGVPTQPQVGVTSTGTTNNIDDIIRKMINRPDISTLSVYGQKRIKDGLKQLISGNNNKVNQGLELIEEGLDDIFKKIPNEKITDRLLRLRNKLLQKLKEFNTKRGGSKRKQKGGALTEQQKTELTDLLKEFLHEAEMAQLKKPNIKRDYTVEGNGICELDNIMTELERLKTEVSTLKIINSNGVRIDTYTNKTLKNLLTNVKNQMNGMDFTEYDPNRMEKVYKGYYAVLQNLITSIMFQRNLVDAYSKIIDVLKNIDSKIKVGKRGANQSKEIKALQNSVRKLTAAAKAETEAKSKAAREKAAREKAERKEAERKAATSGKNPP